LIAERVTPPGWDEEVEQFQDGDQFIVVSDGHDIILSEATDYRGAPKHLWREYWADGQGNLAKRVGKSTAGATLDGREWREMPR
jgi:hypothetical protein